MTPTTNNVGPTTSATERLRALLTERGVEWRGGLPTETMVEADGLDLLYVALPDGRVRAFIRNYLTPEQAVEATLGREPWVNPTWERWHESLRHDENMPGISAFQVDNEFSPNININVRPQAEEN